MDRQMDSRMVADVVAAYLRRNDVPAHDLENVIAAIGRGLRRAVEEAADGVDDPADAAESGDAVVVAPTGIEAGGRWKGLRSPDDPYVDPANSVQFDHLICLEDGHRMKMLKRRLRSKYGMTADEYRAKWGLSNDYPMVAPSYSETRRQVALKGPLPHMNGDASASRGADTRG